MILALTNARKKTKNHKKFKDGNQNTDTGKMRDIKYVYAPFF